jgi:hypothetical protein
MEPIHRRQLTERPKLDAFRVDPPGHAAIMAGRAPLSVEQAIPDAPDIHDVAMVF